MSCFGFTDKGRVRSNNEDSFATVKISDNMMAVVVADGMGGHNGGKEASSFAADSMIKAIGDASVYFEKYTDRQIENFLKNAVIKINKNLYARSTEDSALSGMGTTLVACIIYKGKYYAANVGDSRLYICSDTLSQITSDHSYVTELVSMGVITPDEAANHPNKNVITRAVGTEQSVLPDIFKGRLKENDVVLLCTDGLTNMVSDDVIADVIKKNENPEDITKKLVELANNNGGVDNITVVSVKNHNGGGDNL